MQSAYRSTPDESIAWRFGARRAGKLRRTASMAGNVQPARNKTTTRQFRPRCVLAPWALISLVV